jgi:hypothetical protein
MLKSYVGSCSLSSTNNGIDLSRCELVFENCFVPEENILGQEGKGLEFCNLIIMLLE